MTNKTITRSCCACGKPTACGKMICEACCYEPLPVPPAGGCLQCWNCKADFTLAERANCDGCCWKCGREIDLDDYVIRLQAEVERLAVITRGQRTTIDTIQLRVESLQSELTKARECIDHVMGLLRADKSTHAQHAIILYQGAPSNEFNQSAPADKGQGEPVTYSSTQATNCAGCGKCKHTPLRVDGMGGYVCLTCIDERLEELLDAEQPAPVAVVMPEHRDSDLRSPTYGFARGWNACLDEVTRLNSEPKP